MNDQQVWVIDDDRSIRWVLDKGLSQAGLDVVSFETADEAMELLSGNALPPNAVISDVRMPGTDGLDFMKLLHARHPDVPVIIMTAFSDLDATVAAYEEGAVEFIPKPFDIEAVVEQIRRTMEQPQTGARAKISGVRPATSSLHSPQGENSRTKRNTATLGRSGTARPAPTQAANDSKPEALPEDHHGLIGEAPAMQAVYRAIGRLARSKTTVLINGESGSGKELIARALHRHSPRSQEPFIALNMAAIPHDLMESELFGHERGAFTGAQGTRIGRFEQAHGGTLFLDEIGDMPTTLQTRLLRVLSDGQFYRVGGHQPINVDVRILAATHQNLDQLVRDGRFREDLFHRLNVIRIGAPPLRERREDIPALLEYFLEQSAAELGETPRRMTPAFARHVASLPWPGNVRQLQNTAHWLTIMASAIELEPDDLPPGVRDEPIDTDNDWEAPLRQWAEAQLRQGATGIAAEAQAVLERQLIRAAMHQALDKRQDAAQLLGWGRNTLTRKIRELDLEND